MPMAQIPTYETKEGSLCQSNVIARHVARKLGLFQCTTSVSHHILHVPVRVRKSENTQGIYMLQYDITLGQM